MIRKFCRVFCLVFLIGDFQSSLSQHDNNAINQPTSIINNASVANLDDVWHQASIRLIEKDGIYFGEGHICSGALISSRVVLTAARCLFNSSLKTQRHPAELIVVLGAVNRYLWSPETVTSKITHIRYPTSFDSETMQNDVALLFLSQEVPENHTTVRPIELTWSSNDDSRFTGSVIGYNDDVSNQLINSNVSVVPSESCTLQPQQPRITNGMICVKHSRPNSNICQTDVGASLTIDRKLAGLASWTVDNCPTKQREQFAVYTNVTYHKEWIWQELSDENNTDGSVWGLLGFLTLTWFAFKDKKKIDFRF